MHLFAHNYECGLRVKRRWVKVIPLSSWNETLQCSSEELCCRLILYCICWSSRVPFVVVLSHIMFSVLLCKGGFLSLFHISLVSHISYFTLLVSSGRLSFSCIEYSCSSFSTAPNPFVSSVCDLRGTLFFFYIVYSSSCFIAFFSHRVSFSFAQFADALFPNTRGSRHIIIPDIELERYLMTCRPNLATRQILLPCLRHLRHWCGECIQSTGCFCCSIISHLPSSPKASFEIFTAAIDSTRMRMQWSVVCLRSHTTSIHSTILQRPLELVGN